MQAEKGWARLHGGLARLAWDKKAAEKLEEREEVA